MKKKKIIIICLIVIGACLIGTAIFFLIFNKDSSKKINNQTTNENQTTTQKEATNYIDNVIIDPDATASSIEKGLGRKVNENALLLGKDTYLLNMPSEALIKKYKLSTYVSNQKKYVSRLQEEFQKKFSYKLDEPREKDGYTYQDFHIITIYFGLYSADLNALDEQIFEKEGYKAEDVETNKDTEIARYKARVAAMGILDKNLNVYLNENSEEVSSFMIYQDGKLINQDQTYTLLCGVYGISYQNTNFADEKTSAAQNERIAKYLEEYSNGTSIKG